jgi:hypothetical protein
MAVRGQIVGLCNVSIKTFFKILDLTSLLPHFNLQVNFVDCYWIVIVICLQYEM